MQAFESCPPDMLPPNAVVVSVWKASGRVVADFACTNCPSASEYMVADFPRPVPIALQRAREVAGYCGLEKVVVVLSDPDLWQPTWGRLTGPTNH